eukprot:evm.model.scf_295.6 EVM.evm.TU.scf_295.6   scf_295:59124-62852(-)
MALMALIRNALVNARKYVPPNVKLVELFGYTLGGFYLARYTDSPAGAFDELVVLGGLAWNRPTSCAWAARVYVNNRHARTHGLTHCGLPSRLASFKATPNNDATVMMRGGSKWGGTWWNTDEEIPPQAVVVRNRERWLWFFNSRNGLRMPVCTFNFNNAKKGAKGPRIKMYLPSYREGNWEFHTFGHFQARVDFRGQTEAVDFASAGMEACVVKAFLSHLYSARKTRRIRRCSLRCCVGSHLWLYPLMTWR